MALDILRQAGIVVFSTCNILKSIDDARSLFVCQELDAILKKEAPASTRPNNVDGRSSVEPNQSKSHTKNVAPPANSDLSMSLESLRDASSRLRGLLLVLNTHVLSAQENVELAKPREGGGEIS